MIEAEHIVKYFHETMALNDVSLTIEEAKCTALIGKNGAGKSTLIDIIIGNKNYKSGEIIDHYNLINKKDMTVLFQKSQFPKMIKVKELFDLYCAIYDDHLTKEEFITVTNFQENQLNQYASKLSGGQQRILDFALTVIGKPKFLILDEPTSAMDIEIREHFWRIITNFKHKGLTILYTTHYIEEVERMSDNIAILDDGSIRMTGDLNNIKSTEKSSNILIPTKYKNIVSDLDNCTKLEHKFVIKTEHVNETIMKLVKRGLDLNEVEIHKVSLLEILFSNSEDNEGVY